MFDKKTKFFCQTHYVIYVRYVVKNVVKKRGKKMW